ncbi:MAG: hypothetical protein PHW18_03605 [Sulfuricurvum sp.]|uniref:hypothetical protein n=1 Tax=Sulfuricurvum sp. TaxID=2025608 RepID=UPI00262AF75D|nr:hypothetical protein [Sulfuricurvum sp.]MDD2828644.1 hypothetical protein [Sulfuricurvum sp.]MDD4948321.1 hypothetical protein [Sulfuricurvum sp.]
MKMTWANIKIGYLLVVMINIVFLIHYTALLIHIKLPDYYRFEGVALLFNANKKRELLEYILHIVFLGLFFFMIIQKNSYLQRYKLKIIKILAPIIRHKKYFAVLVLSCIIVPILIIMIELNQTQNVLKIKLIFEIVLLSILIGFPFQIQKKISSLGNSIKKINTISLIKSSWFYSFILFFGFLQLIYIFIDPIFFKAKVTNEFFNIPETSYLQQDTNAIDNTIFFNQHFSSAITHKTDVTSEAYCNNCISGALSDLGILPPLMDDYNLSFNESLVCINGILDYSQLSESAKIKLYPLILQNQNTNEELKIKNYSSEEESFLNKNAYEIKWGIYSRGFLHHQNFMLSPINELGLNRPISEINAQYGLGSAYVMKFFLERMTSGITYDNWLKLNYSFYYIYFIFFVMIVWLITRDVRVTSIVFLLSLSLLNNRKYDFILLGPAEAPWRHFIDIFVVYTLYRFALSRKLLYLFVALVLSLLAIMLNPQIGLMIFLAFIGSTIFYSIYENYLKTEVFIGTLISTMIAGVLYIKFSSENVLGKYYIDGALGFHVPFSDLMVFLSVFIVGYSLFFIILNKRSTKIPYLHIIFLFLYSQALIVYVMWHYNYDGLLPRSFIYILTFALLINTLYLEQPKWKKYSIGLSNIVIIGTLLVYGTSLKHFMKSKHSHDAIFDTHTTYTWNLEKAKFISTMNPALFENSVQLIQKYSLHNNGVYIISEYDNILPFLSSKYSLMPFFDMKWYIVTPQELHKSIATLRENKPEYLFVDTGIDRNLNNEIIDPKFPQIGDFNEESIWRVQRLNLLNKIFQSIASDYQLIEKGYLISVYKKCNNEKKY